MNPYITIYEPGFVNPVQVEVIDPACSWSVKDMGSFSSIMTRKERHSLPFDILIGKWMTWQSRAGIWGGIIKNDTSHVGSRYVEISSDDLRSVFQGRLTGNKTFNAKPIGSHFLKMIRDCDSVEPILIDDFQADAGGEPITWSVRDDDLFDQINNLASTGSYEWRVSIDDATLYTVAEFRNEIGRDLWGEVAITEGAEPLDGDYTITRDGIVNSLLGIANDDNYASKQRYVAKDRGSIDTYGEIQKAKRYPGLVTKAVIYPVTRADVERLKDPPGPLLLTLHNEDNLYLSFEEGDKILVHMITADVSRIMRVEARSLSSDGTLQISGSSVAL